MARWSIAGLALLLAACSNTEPSAFLDLGRLSRDLVMFVSLGEADSVDASFVLDADEAPERSVELSVAPGHRLVGAAFDRSDLLARSPRLDDQRLQSLTLGRDTMGLAQCREGVLDPGLGRTQIRWPDRSVAFEWLVDEERLVTRDIETDWSARMTPIVPVHVGRCAGHPEIRLRPFATPDPILQEDTLVNGELLAVGLRDINDFIRLDEERALVAYPPYLVLAERGVGYVDEPGRNLASDEGWNFRAVAAGALDPDRGGQRLVLVSINGPASDPATGSQISDATIVGDQITPGRVLMETSRVVDAVYIFPATGRTVVYERPAQIYANAEPGGELTLVAEFANAQLETDKRGRLVPTGLAEYPLALVGSRAAAVYLGSSDARVWISIDQGLSPGLTVRGFADLTLGEGSTLYAGNSAGHAFQRDFADEVWTRLDARLDPALVGSQCAVVGETPACGFAQPQRSWQHLSAFADTAGQPALVAFADLCSLTFIIGADGCTSHFVIDDFGPVARGSDDEVARARNEGGFLTLATERGRLFEVPWPALGAGP